MSAAFVCRNCRKAVPEECHECPNCGAAIDPFGTIQAPVFRPGVGLGGRPASPPPREPDPFAPEPEDDDPPPRPKPSPRPPASSSPAPPREPAPPRPKPKAPPSSRPRPASPAPAPSAAYAPPQTAPDVPYAPDPASPPNRAEDDRPKHWLGRLKGAMGLAPNQGDPPTAPDRPPAPSPAYGPPAGAHPPAYSAPSPPPVARSNGQAPAPAPPPPAGVPGAPWPQAGPGGWGPSAPQAPPWQGGPANPAGSWPAHAPGGYAPPQPASPPYGMPAYSPGSDDDLRTIGAQGVDLGRLRIQQQQYVLQIFNRDGQWVEWQRIGPAGLKLGRVKDSKQHPALSTMASRHLKLSFEANRLIAEDLGSLNGVYRLVTHPVPLEDGQRFRVGRYVVAFQAAGPLKETEPLVGEDGEEFCGADLPVLGHLDFIGRDGRPGPRVALTKSREPTVLGRGGKPGRPVDVALLNDDRISGLHAQLRPEGDRLLLEDLGSRNGTYAQLLRPTPVDHNDVLLVGQLLLRVVAG